MGHGLGGGDGQLNWSISINSDEKKNVKVFIPKFRNCEPLLIWVLWEFAMVVILTLTRSLSHKDDFDMDYNQ